jgi:hypothetical protein
MEIVGWAISVLFVVALIGGIFWLGSTLRARSMKRGN